MDTSKFYILSFTSRAEDNAFASANDVFSSESSKPLEKFPRYTDLKKALIDAIHYTKEANSQGHFCNYQIEPVAYCKNGAGEIEACDL